MLPESENDFDLRLNNLLLKSNDNDDINKFFFFCKKKCKKIHLTP